MTNETDALSTWLSTTPPPRHEVIASVGDTITAQEAASLLKCTVADVLAAIAHRSVPRADVRAAVGGATAVILTAASADRLDRDRERVVRALLDAGAVHVDPTMPMPCGSDAQQLGRTPGGFWAQTLVVTLEVA